MLRARARRALAARAQTVCRRASRAVRRRRRRLLTARASAVRARALPVRRIVRAFLVEEQKVVKKVIKAQGAATKAA